MVDKNRKECTRLAKTELKTNQKTKAKTKIKEPSLKGTLVSVFILGAFILLSWFGVYLLFLGR